jgi:N-acetylated-alpha-linked acidic dipeptidase
MTHGHGLLLVAALVAPAAWAQDDPETRLRATLSAEQIGAFHARLTREPHVAGTPEGKAVAAELERTLTAMGLATEVRSYDVYLSYPRQIAIRLTQPERRELPVSEAADPRDPDTANPRLMPGFVAYSASGDVTAPVVYVNYGLPTDYAALEAKGIAVRGKIALARYGKVHRAVKVHAAEQRGAVGILIYSDPADDGAAQGEVWPEGPWRAPSFVQRGNAKYSWFWHGDPLTPGVAASATAKRLDPRLAPTLPKIPAAVLSAAAGQQIRARLSGAGPGPAVVEMDVAMTNGLRPIYDVLARIEGKEEPDREVILGTHHDAWTFGGVDPGSAAASVLELARAFSELRKSGWQPRRSIVFAFWDAEEYGLIGSTEYAEDRGAERSGI